MRWAVLLLVSMVAATLMSDTGRPPAERMSVGDVATRTVKAPYRFTWTDYEGLAASRAAAREAVDPVFVWRPSARTETLDGLSEAVAHARSRLEAAKASAEAAAATARTDSDAPEVTVLTDALLMSLREGFERDVGVALSKEAFHAFAEAGFPEASTRLARGWVDVALGSKHILAPGSNLPPGNDAVRITSLGEDAGSFDLVPRDRIVSLDDARRELRYQGVPGPGSEAWSMAVAELVSGMLVADLFFDLERTEAARVSAASKVEVGLNVVKRGETLFREGDVLNDAQTRKYAALQDAARGDGGILGGIAARTGFLALMLGALYVFRGRGAVPKVSELWASGAMLVLVVLMARLVEAAAPGVAALVGNGVAPSSVYLLTPVAGVAALFRVLLGERWLGSFVAACAAAGTMALDGGLYIFLYFLLTSVVAATSVDQLRERIAVVRSGFYAGVFGAFVMLLAHFVDLFSGSGEVSQAMQIRPLWSMLASVLGGVMSSFLVLALVPIFEAVGFVTNYRMQELASLNHPLMRQLMIRAPGTYHHSVVVGTLSEAACEAIGANGLQAKIAAYFHDVGKALKPQYFVENQRDGANRHDALAPEQSARVIIAHVTEGERMAREHRLPQPIIDNIQMHHGTGLLQYFFAKAQMAADDPDSVDEAAFRYPGPKPSTREAGVVMLADKVEAATRSIRQPTEDNIRAMILRIINSVMADGQFSECPLTFREIYTIADTFVRVLMGIYHQRIEYPQTSDVSSSPAVGATAARAQQDTKNQGMITLELDQGVVASASGRVGLWNEDVDVPDDDTDYESVHNLPAGEP